jgi:AcrR family transcriptional regulator
MTSGRPRATSRQTIAEAATELFLERGYEGTSVADIATRAGVSRSSFFNYFGSKADILWAGLDERIVALQEELAAQSGPADVPAALRRLGDGFAPDALALAIAHAAAMGLDDELLRGGAVRAARIAGAVRLRLVREGVDALAAEVAAAAHAGAVQGALRQWALAGPGRHPLSDTLARALESAAATLPRRAPASPPARQATSGT